jgi:AraC-like DNA-binding protein
MFEHQDISLGSDVRLVAQDGACSVFRLQAKDGDGLMTSYQLYPGIYLLYNDYHAESYGSSVQVKTDTLCIDHCREGRLEWSMDDERRLYLAKDMVLAHAHVGYRSQFYSPARHYHGITISIFVERAQDSLAKAMDDFGCDLKKLREKLCPGLLPQPLSKSSIPAHFTRALYNAPVSGGVVLMRCKVLELLLHLDSLPHVGAVSRQYFYRSDVEKVKTIEKMMTSDPARHYTIAKLSERFEITQTTLKSCFKGVFGISPYAYMRGWRMRAAATELRTSNKTVTEIAVGLGYDSPSKFAHAFRACLGYAPRDYRQQQIADTKEKPER